jgi:hypothetical protein
MSSFASGRTATATQRRRAARQGRDHGLIDVNDQLFFREELERAIALHIDRIPKIAVGGWKNGNDDALFMIVGRLFNPLAYRKF